MDNIKKIQMFMTADGISNDKLKKFFEVGFKMETNPLPMFRKWMKQNSINGTNVFFSDKTREEVEYKGKNKGKSKSSIVVRTIKGECGQVDDVEIHYFSAKNE